MQLHQLSPLSFLPMTLQPQPSFEITNDKNVRKALNIVSGTDVRSIFFGENISFSEYFSSNNEIS